MRAYSYKRFAIVIGVAAVGVMALGAQTATAGDVDSVLPDLQLSGPKKQSLEQPAPTRACAEHGRCPPNVQLEASCEHERVDGMVAPGEGCTVSAEGKLTKVKNDKLKPVHSHVVAPGETDNLGSELTESQRKQVRKALDDGKNVQAKVIVRAKDADGNVATAKRTIKLVE
jgi:uncharacterized membrane protein